MKNKKIMIIGGTGALGKQLTNRWDENNDILIFSRNEHKQEYIRNHCIVLEMLKTKSLY